MTATKRLLTLVGLVLAVVIGSSIPASAGYSETAALATQSFTAATVAPPTSVVGSLSCGPSSSTMGVTWAASTTTRVNGYRVSVHFSDGYVQHTELPAGTTSWTKSITTYNVTAYSIRYSVTAVTDFGWFTQSGLTGSFRC
jgi:hypothetical protein